FEQNVYASFWNFDAQTVAVHIAKDWHMRPQWALLPNPFPGEVIIEHPITLGRIRDPYGIGANFEIPGLTVLARVGNGALKIAYSRVDYDGSTTPTVTWRPPFQVAATSNSPLLSLSDRTWRRAQDFDMATNADSASYPEFRLRIARTQR